MEPCGGGPPYPSGGIEYGWRCGDVPGWRDGEPADFFGAALELMGADAPTTTFILPPGGMGGKGYGYGPASLRAGYMEYAG